MYDFGDGYKAIAPPGEMLPMDSGCERALVSTLIDSRRVVALQVLCVSVETAHSVQPLTAQPLSQEQAVAKSPPAPPQSLAPPQPLAPSLKASQTLPPQPNLSVMPKAATCTPTTKFCAMNGGSCLKMAPWCRFCPTCGSKQV